MRRRVLPLLFFLISGLGLAYLLTGLILGLRGVYNTELTGWLNLTGFGVGTGFLSVLLLALCLFLVALWLLFFIAWLLKRKDKTKEFVELP